MHGERSIVLGDRNGNANHTSSKNLDCNCRVLQSFWVKPKAENVPKKLTGMGLIQLGDSGMENATTAEILWALDITRPNDQKNPVIKKVFL